MLYRNCLNTTLFVLFLFVLSIGKAQTYDAPLFTCAQHRNNNVELTWELPNVTCGTFNGYVIWVSNNATGPFNILTTITSQTQTQFTHIGATTAQKWFYYMTSDFNCPGFVSTNSDTFQSSFDFAEPIIKRVSVENDKSFIEWYPNPEKQTHSYLIFIPQTKLLDSIIGRNNTTYIDTNQKPNLGSVAYSLVAQDKCRGGDYGKSAESFAHGTIFLKVSENACTGNTTLEWTPYIGWDSVYDYRILVEKNNSGEKLIATNSKENRSFVFNDYIVGDSLCMRIEARKSKDTTIISHSNRYCFKSSKIQKPRYFIITKIDVLKNNTVELTWITDSLSSVKTISILRGFKPSEMSEVGRISLTGKMPFLSTYKDTTAPTANLLYYRIALIDSCGGGDSSKIETHLLLLAKQELFFENKLNWIFQSLDHSNVSKYVIYRKIDTTFVKLLETNSITDLYRDNIESLINEKGQFCYKVEVYYIVDTPGLFTTDYISRSNEVCITQRALVHVPNAFRPGGVNVIFKPMVIFGDVKNFNMKIYNRWGALIFETTDPNAGWNGTINGTPAPMEEYPYVIQLNGLSGTPIERKGTVLLMR